MRDGGRINRKGLVRIRESKKIKIWEEMGKILESFDRIRFLMEKFQISYSDERRYRKLPMF